MPVDLVDRDPNEVNGHIKVAFEDVLAEPEGAHSLNCIWSLSSSCFNCCKLCVYNLYTFCFGIWIAAFWGCEFGILAIYHVWWITPAFRFLELNCAVCQKLYGLCVHCCLDPCFEACGNIFFAFKKN